jgi:thioredoxin 1
VKEGNASPTGAAAGYLIDQAVPRGARAVEGGIEVGHAVADVMDARSALRQEPGDRSIGVDGFEQLDVHVAEGQAHDSGAIGPFSGAGLKTQDVAIKRKSVGDVRDRDADMRETRGGGSRHAVILTTAKGSEKSMQELHLLAVTDATFEAEVEKHDGLAIVDFWATWCGPCRAVAPIMEQLAGEHAGKVKVIKINVDENQRTTMRFNVRSIPSVLFFKGGRHVDTVVGAYPKPVFDEKIQKHI